MKRRRTSEEDYINKSDPLFREDNGASPVLARELDFNADESDPEITFTSQANKKRRMADEAMKIWFREELKSSLSTLATKEQLNGVLSVVESNTEQIAAQGREIQGLRSSLHTLEMDANRERRSFDARVKKLIMLSLIHI